MIVLFINLLLYRRKINYITKLLSFLLLPLLSLRVSAAPRILLYVLRRSSSPSPESVNGNMSSQFSRKRPSSWLNPRSG
jgi:hypothetical protein